MTFTLADLCRIFGVSKWTIYRWTDRDMLPQPVRIGRKTLWRLADFQPYVQALEYLQAAQQKEGQHEHVSS